MKENISVEQFSLISSFLSDSTYNTGQNKSQKQKLFLNKVRAKT